MSEPTVPSTAAAEPFSPIRWEGDSLKLLDQTLLPTEEVWMDCTEPEQVADAIRRLAVRGAPAIGVAAAYGLVLGMRPDSDPGHFAEVSEMLGQTRPTAVNLRWALDRGREVYEPHRGGGTRRGADRRCSPGPTSFTPRTCG